MNDSADGLEPPSIPRARQIQIIASMYIGYAMFMVLRMAPPVAGASITGNPDLGIDTGTWGKILAAGTLGAVVGKIIGGLAADKFGGRLTFFVGLVVASIGVAGFSASSNALMFQATLFLALMAKSSGWPSMTKIITLTFQPSEYGRVWGTLATSSRIGTLIATLCLGGLLSVLPWQLMLCTTAFAGVLIAFGFFVVLRPRNQAELPSGPNNKIDSQSSSDSELQPTAPHPLHSSTLPTAIGYFFRSRQFWLITVSLMALTIMWDFLMMVPIYLTNTFDVSASEASVASSAFPFGSLVSVLVGGFVFDRLSRRQTAIVMGGLLIAATASIVVFLLLPHLEVSKSAAVYISAASLLVFGICVSPCYYLPMSIFSIEFGGPHSGFLVSLLDALAFGANAVFYYYAGEVAEKSWPAFFQILVGVAAVAAVTTFIFLLGEAKRLQTNDVTVTTE